MVKFNDMNQPLASENRGRRSKVKPETYIETFAQLEAEARKHTDLAITTLVGIAKNGKQPAAARVSAAKEILDRGWGKPKQSVDLTGSLNVAALNNEELDAAFRDELASFLASQADGDSETPDKSKLN
jgi:hypothetical protein